MKVTVSKKVRNNKETTMLFDNTAMEVQELVDDNPNPWVKPKSRKSQRIAKKASGDLIGGKRKLTPQATTNMAQKDINLSPINDESSS